MTKKTLRINAGSFYGGTRLEFGAKNLAGECVKT
jgi:hypothetical protein